VAELGEWDLPRLSVENEVKLGTLTTLSFEPRMIVSVQFVRHADPLPARAEQKSNLRGWIKNGKNVPRWHLMNAGPAPGTAGSYISAQELLNTEIELGVRND